MVVVGEPWCELTRAMVRLAHEYEVEAVQCEDVYLAVAATARASGRRMLVVGTMRELAREDGRFFQIAEANAQRCCCLLGHDPVMCAGGMFAAIRSGASVVRDVQQVDAIFKDWLANGERRPRRTSPGDLTDDDLRATEAELIALLGQQTDV